MTSWHAKVCCAAVLALAAGGCAFGPRALERSHLRYNEAVKQVEEEQQLLNIVRLRYNDNPVRLDVASIATQYELSGQLEARPFFSSEGVNLDPPVGPFASFATVLPFAGVSGTNRPTISLAPLNDPENVRPLFIPSTLDGIIFLSQTSWPISTVFRLWVDRLNRVPNAVTASGPARDVVPEFREFQRAVALLQGLQDDGAIQFNRVEKVRETGSPLPAEAVTASAVIEAAKNGFEYRRREDGAWVLVKYDRNLELRIEPRAIHDPRVIELCETLRLTPGLTVYEITVSATDDTADGHDRPRPGSRLNIYPRSTAQAMFYMSYGVEVPNEHLCRGMVRPSVLPDGQVFDWQELTAGLFTVHSVKQHCRPKCAHIAVKYHDYWFYIDERDSDSKSTFALVMIMTRVNLLGTRQGGPALTLPVGR